MDSDSQVKVFIAKERRGPSGREPKTLFSAAEAVWTDQLVRDLERCNEADGSHPLAVRKNPIA